MLEKLKAELTLLRYGYRLCTIHGTVSRGPCAECAVEERQKRRTRMWQREENKEAALQRAAEILLGDKPHS